MSVTLQAWRLGNSRRAFTLIELLVVTGIVAVLAALSLPVLSRAKRRGLQVQCLNNLRQQGISLQGFLAEHRVYPLWRNMDFERGGYSEHGRNWLEALGSPLEPVGVMLCPSPQQFPPGFPRPYKGSSYCYNAFARSWLLTRTALGLGGNTLPVHMTSNPVAPPVGESEVIVPSEMMAIVDDVCGVDSLAWVSAEVLEDTRAASRHRGRANVLSCDGHAESQTLGFIFKNTRDEALVRWNRDHQPHREQLEP